MHHKPKKMKLFQNNNSSSKNSISYLEEQMTDYEVFIPWKNSFAGNNFFDWVKNRFKDYDEEKIQNDKNIFFFNNESTFAFRINAEVLDLSPHTLWNYWKDEILDCGYVLKNSESVLKDKLTTQRYYLKPRLKFKVEKEQLYGNITLELIKSEALPKYIMLKCSWYSDRNFNDAQPFGELVKILTN